MITITVWKCQILFLPCKQTKHLHVRLFWAYTLTIYRKYFIAQRGIKSIFSVPAHCQNLNMLNRRRTIHQLKTISHNVLIAYVFTTKGYSIYRFNTLRVGNLFKVYECAVGVVGLHRILATAFTHKAFGCRSDWLSPRSITSSTNRVDNLVRLLHLLFNFCCGIQRTTPTANQFKFVAGVILRFYWVLAGNILADDASGRQYNKQHCRSQDEGDAWMTIKSVGFWFSQTKCFSLIFFTNNKYCISS